VVELADPLPVAAAAVTMNGIVPPFDATSISEEVVGSVVGKAGQAAPVVYENVKVPLVEEVAGV